LLAFSCVRWMPERIALVIGTFITVGSCIWCVRNVCRRLAPTHWFCLALRRIPVLGRAIVRN
jgi:hypothetical protein